MGCMQPPAGEGYFGFVTAIRRRLFDLSGCDYLSGGICFTNPAFLFATQECLGTGKGLDLWETFFEAFGLFLK